MGTAANDASVVPGPGTVERRHRLNPAFARRLAQPAIWRLYEPQKVTSNRGFFLCRIVDLISMALGGRPAGIGLPTFRALTPAIIGQPQFLLRPWGSATSSLSFYLAVLNLIARCRYLGAAIYLSGVHKGKTGSPIPAVGNQVLSSLPMVVVGLFGYLVFV